MASYSNFLSLVLPGFNEYRDAWWEPLNANFSSIDQWSQQVNQEIVNARFTKKSLAEFLAIGHESTGKLKPTDEMIAARNSPIYGFPDPKPSTYLLKSRLDQTDWEVLNGREGQSDLRALSAFKFAGIKNQILDGAKDANGYPLWMASLGTNVVIDGSVTPLWLSIEGKLGRVRTLKNIPITGAAGTRYIYAQYLSDDDAGKIVVDGDSVIAPPIAANGVTSLNIASHPIFFNDATRDFTLLDVKPGDILNLLDQNDAGKYLIAEVTPGAIVTQLRIIGEFPFGGISAINYNIIDPLAVATGSSLDALPVAGRLYIGEADWDGAGITAVRPRHFKDSFIGEWRAVNITTGLPNLGTSVPGVFETRYDHNLGSDILDISVQVSTANDGSAPVEEMCIATITNGLNVAISDGIGLSKTSTLSFLQATHAPDTLTPNTPQAYTQGGFSGGSLAGTIDFAKTGTVTGSLSGDIEIDNGVRVKWSSRSIWIKNAVLSKFYKDYSGTPKTEGFIRVIVRKRG